MAARLRFSAPIHEFGKTYMPLQLDMIQIVEGGALQGAVAEIESGGPDNIHRNAEARTKAEYRTGILRYVGLIERQAHL